MLPSQFSRGPSLSGASFSVGFVVAAVAGAVLLAFVGWVVIGMATPPEGTPVTVDVPVKV